MPTSAVVHGVIYGIVFCVISAMSDVYIAKMTQDLNPAVFIIYCFVLATLVFLCITLLRSGRGYLHKVSQSKKEILLVNVAVLLNWGGLIVSLKYLEPAVVGIASVACGPALTIIISRYIRDLRTTPDITESLISWGVMAGVMVMLLNSYLGHSGVMVIRPAERLLGIVCVLLSGLGTVLYTFFSKSLISQNWQASEILAGRNILILIVALLYASVTHLPLSLELTMLLIVVVLSVTGHLLPIFLIQKSIAALSPLHIALLMLLLPVFTLLFQFTDQRIVISWQTIVAVLVLTLLLALLGISKFLSTARAGGRK